MKIDGAIPNPPNPAVPPGAGNTGPVDGVNQALPVQRDATGPQQGDKVEISAAAREAAKAQEVASQSNKDEIREDAVQNAREFLEQGLYNDQGVLDKTATSLASLFQAQA